MNSDQYTQSGTAVPVKLSEQNNSETKRIAELENKIRSLESHVQAQDQDMRKIVRDIGRIRADIEILASSLRKG